MKNLAVHVALEEQADAVSELERRLELPEGLFAHMGEDPDSVIVLKMAVAIEAVLNDKIAELLTSATRHPKAHFDGTETLVEMIRKANSPQRLKLALDIGIIYGFEMQWLTLIADIRNRYAHHISNFSRSAWDVVATMKDKERLKTFCFKKEPRDDYREWMLSVHVGIFVDFLNRVHAFERVPGRSLFDLLREADPGSESPELGDLAE